MKHLLWHLPTETSFINTVDLADFQRDGSRSGYDGFEFQNPLTMMAARRISIPRDRCILSAIVANQSGNLSDVLAELNGMRTESNVKIPCAGIREILRQDGDIHRTSTVRLRLKSIVGRDFLLEIGRSRQNSPARNETDRNEQDEHNPNTYADVLEVLHDLENFRMRLAI